MIINNTPQDTAVISNVHAVSSFAIKATAKSFHILSSGLYANKIRAIIRELSCNAVDSHVAAGNSTTPFDIHLPTVLEPYFSIRDYGTGLNHDQVTNIYTTYFESTKTNSNDFIGALGLGSKSPFSYTDNFTVTAIKDGRKGIYTAFINDNGVPSIALMTEESTDEPTGVEVKFAVQNQDFSRFIHEAQVVYEYFSLRPVVQGLSTFQFKDPSYKEKNIIPGVHQVASSLESYAIMGNIKYPINLPQTQVIDQTLVKMLHCGLVMEFNIGELDFQASREGLSYVPQTILAIKHKLEKLNAQLSKFVADKAEKIENLWERALHLQTLHQDQLWKAAVIKYVKDSNFGMIDLSSHWYFYIQPFKISIEDLAEQYNIKIRGFSKNMKYESCTTLNTSSKAEFDSSGKEKYVEIWEIPVSKNVYFVINDTNIGSFERAKYHFSRNLNQVVAAFVLEAEDKSKPMLTNEFFKKISNPPESYILQVSDLAIKERKTTGKNVTILQLGEGRRRSYYKPAEMTWQAAGTADTMDNNVVRYYLPLSGFQNLGVYTDVKTLYSLLYKSGVYRDVIYGVRKSDIEWIKTQKNWIDLDKHIVDNLQNIDKEMVNGIVKNAINFDRLYPSKGIITHIKNKNSLYLTVYNAFKDVTSVNETDQWSLQQLFSAYKVSTNSNVDPTATIAKYRQEVNNIHSQYPLLSIIRGGPDVHVAHYINLIDSSMETK